MAYEQSIEKYRRAYTSFLALYPRGYRDRYGEGMAQTFADLMRERAESDGHLLACAVWMFAETSGGIIQENTTYMFSKRTLTFIAGTLSLLLIPFFAMMLKISGWDWDGTDFAIMAVLLTGAGIGLAAASNGGISLSRRLVGLVVVGMLFLLYVHLAVGIVDSWPFAGS